MSHQVAALEHLDSCQLSSLNRMADDPNPTQAWRKPTRSKQPELNCDITKLDDVPSTSLDNRFFPFNPVTLNTATTATCCCAIKCDVVRREKPRRAVRG